MAFIPGAWRTEQAVCGYALGPTPACAMQKRSFLNQPEWLLGPPCGMRICTLISNTTAGTKDCNTLCREDRAGSLGFCPLATPVYATQMWSFLHQSGC